MSDLLPPNATAPERALASAVGRISAVPVPLHHLWNPATCPPALLPWLAWALSVDVWDPAWPERTKRAVLRESFAVHRRKGTAGAVRRALAAAGVPADVIEWWQEGGDPHTFRVRVDVRALLERGETFSAALVSGLRRSVDAVKPVRSHYAIAAFYGVPGVLFAGAAVVTGARISVFPLLPREWSGSAVLEVAGVLRANARLDLYAKIGG